MKRILTLALLIASIALTCPALTFGQTGATIVPDHVTLTWTGDTAKTMTVTWRTDTTATVGFVHYQKGTALTSAAHLVKATPSEFKTDLGDSLLFRATLTDLSAGTQYCYRVGDGKNWSAAREFRTADPKSRAFKFLIFGDSQSIATGTSPYSEWRDTVQNAYKANPDARFMVNTGDLVDVGQSGAHWNGWFAATAGVIDTIPAMTTTGNHESGGSTTMRRPAYWDAQFAYPPNGPSELKNQAYSYDYGPAHLVVLDSQQVEQKQYGDILTPQQKWLDADLKATTATWKIAFFHRAVYELHPTRASKDVRAAFCPTIEGNRVDLVFNGHDHGVGRTYAINNGAYYSKPSQGTIYWVDGRSGGKVYKTLEKKPWNTFFYSPAHKPNYLVVEVNDTKLTIKTVSQDGALIDTFFIDKKKDIDSDSGLPISAAAPAAAK